VPRQKDGIDHVYQDKGEIADGDDPDQWILGHCFGVNVERFAAIRYQQLKVAGQMDYQKQDQKKTGEGHQKFSSQCAIQGLGYPAHIYLYYFD
jgi:hypothetical protein